jgi:hypothetical protein
MTSPTPRKRNPMINKSVMTDAQKAEFEALPDEMAKARWWGFGPGTRPDFDEPDFKTVEGIEQVIKKGNAFITLGLDRPHIPSSGFGGLKATHCAAIDIVAGRKGFFAKKRNHRGKIELVDNDFKADAARIYLSQRSDPDTNFFLNPGVVGNTSMQQPRSTVVVKADTLRFVANENIKLVTRTDNTNSQGAALGTGLKHIYGIDLMAMNGDGGQYSLVKGQKLVQFLRSLVGQLQKCVSTVSTYVVQTRKLHIALLKHKHHGAFFGATSAPDFQDILPEAVNMLINNITNIDVGNMMTNQGFNMLVMEYLTSPGGATFIERDEEGNKVGAKYILSAYNTTN